MDFGGVAPGRQRLQGHPPLRLVRHGGAEPGRPLRARRALRPVRPHTSLPDACSHAARDAAGLDKVYQLRGRLLMGSSRATSRPPWPTSTWSSRAQQEGQRRRDLADAGEVLASEHRPTLSVERRHNMRFKHSYRAGTAASWPRAALAQAAPVTVKGSDTMVILGQRWAEEYMHKKPGLPDPGHRRRLGHRHQRAHQRHHRHLHVLAGDEGAREVQAARPLQHHRHRDPGGPRRPVGLRAQLQPADRDLDAISCTTSSPGKITNWKDLGGPDNRIIVYSRENSSGTYVFFKDNVLEGRDFTPRAQTMPGTASVVNAVTKEKFGIGYGGAAFAKGIKILKVKKDDRGPAIAPDAEDRHDRRPTRWRGPLFFYVRNKPSGDIKKFVDWVLSDEGQQVVARSGTTPSSSVAPTTSRPSSSCHKSATVRSRRPGLLRACRLHRDPRRARPP